MQEKNEHIAPLSFAAKFSFYYSCNFQINLNNIGDKILILTKYKGYK